MKTRTLWAAIALSMMATTVTGCSSSEDSILDPETTIDPVTPPATLELTRAEQELIDHSNQFAFNLFRTAQDPSKSQILSPISITYALGMLNNGAAGDTQAQINTTLGFGNTGADGINTFCHKMMSLAPTLDPLTKVMIANTIYLNKGYEMNKDFVKKAKTFFDCEPESRDFHDGQTIGVINQWASDHTEKMIQKVIDETSFDPAAVSYLLNAIYFKGMWKNKFDKAATKDEAFHLASGQQVTLPMMHQTEDFMYAENDAFQAICLPYGNGSYQMTILLPKSNTMPQVPTADEWQQLTRKMHTAMVDLRMPRFETDTEIGLIPVMAALGISDAFVPGKADFSLFCDTPTYIGMMKQVAKIKLDEEGTEAAAVIIVGNFTTATVEEPRIVNFHADHPFLYVISEQQTGAVFFIGQYAGN